ncbi:MAG: hypothetical protein HY963_03340 [Ignavibacteriales bacterium]|nr:hypothetical protein [Ignavibacteriales bacterium]
MSLVAEKYETPTIGFGANLSEFYKLAKDHFQISIKNDNVPINNIKESIRFFSLGLPPELKEIFIPFSDAPLFWTYESSLLAQIEEFMKSNFSRSDNSGINKQIYENYTRWATAKLKNEKEYFAITTVNFIERDLNKHNFLKLILKGIIFTYHNTLYNPVKANELLTNAVVIINSLRLNDQLKAELKYIISLYRGFIHLKENSYEQAQAIFKESLELKPYGSTAKIYFALTEINLAHEDLASYFLNEIFNYDLHRLAIALKTNNAGMFSYFYRNAFFYNVFSEKDFCKCYDSIEQLLNVHKNYDNEIINICIQSLAMIKANNLSEYIDEEMNKSLLFTEKIIQNYSKSTNILIYATYPEFYKKLAEIVACISAKIRTRYYNEVNQKLSTFNTAISENISAEKHLLDELEAFKVKNKIDLKDSLQKINEDYDYEAHVIEKLLNGLPQSDRYNPRASMSSYMIYNIIIAFLVFFFGGVAGYSNKMVGDASEFNSMLTFILITAIKWGAISFFLGLIISLIFSVIIIVERFEVKSKLQKRLVNLKYGKDKLINEVNKNYSNKEKILSENISSSISHHRKKVEELKEQLNSAEKAFTAEAEEQIKKIASQLPTLPN